MDLMVAKGISLALLFLLPILLGSLPFFLPRCPYIKGRLEHLNAQRFLSYLNCFAGGFFLGTCLLVVLGQGLNKFEEYRHLVRLQYRFPFFEVGIGVGFFLVALMEKLIHAACVRRPHCGEREEDDVINAQHMTRRSFTTLFESDDDLYEVPDNMDAASTQTILSLSDPQRQSRHSQEWGDSERGSEAPSPFKQLQNDDDGAQDPSFDAVKDSREAGRCGEITHSVEVDSASESSVLRVVLLVLALSFHTIFDGLALGLQTEGSEVMTLMAALAIHKVIMSVVLGVELATVLGDQKLYRPFLALLLYSLASPVGVAIGIGVTSGHVHKPAELLTGTVLQAIAAGVFLYVTCFEILARDMVDRQDCSLLRVLIAILGFLVLTALESAIAFEH